MTRRLLRIGIPAAAAAAVLLVVGLWPAGKQRPNGFAWADVARQVEAARTMRLRITYPTNGKSHGAATILVKAPDRLREEYAEPQPLIAVFNGSGQVVLNPSLKLYERISDSSAMRRDNPARHFLEAFAFPYETTGRPKASMGSRTYDLAFEGEVEREDRRLRKCRLNEPGSPQASAPQVETRTFFWLDPRDGRLVLITQEQDTGGGWLETRCTSVELDVELSDDLFSLEKPDAYEDVVTHALAARMPSEMRALALEYQHARERINSYRLIGWYVSLKDPCVRFRSMRSGEQWRIDEYRLGKVGVRTDLDFEETWEQLDQFVPLGMIMPDDTGVSCLLRYTNPGAGPVTEMTSMSPDAIPNRQQRIEDLGWPLWPVYPPSVTTGPAYEYDFLPGRPDRPGLIGIRARLNQPLHPAMQGQQTWSVEDFWIDPNRDYLCVFRALHVRKGQPWQDNPDWVPDEPEGDPEARPRGDIPEYDTETQITEFSRTLQGRWYPTRFEKRETTVAGGKRYGNDAKRAPVYVLHLRLEPSGPVPAELFAWPVETPPQPADSVKAQPD